MTEVPIGKLYADKDWEWWSSTAPIIAQINGLEHDDADLANAPLEAWIIMAVHILGEATEKQVQFFLAGLQLWGYPVPAKFKMVEGYN